jgi:hypothetical protein
MQALGGGEQGGEPNRAPAAFCWRDSEDDETNILRRLPYRKHSSSSSNGFLVNAGEATGE